MIDIRASAIALLVLAACGGSAAIDDAGTDAQCIAPDGGGGAAPDAGAPDPLCTGTPCGGDVTGTWEIVASCGEGTGDASFLRCPEGTLTYRDFEVTGTWDIAADGTISTLVDEHATADAALPLSCYGLRRCDQLEDLAAASDVVLECATSAVDDRCLPTACDCRGTLDRQDLVLAASIVTDPAAGTFVLTMGEENVPGEYCVEGDELWLHGTRFGSAHIRYRFRRAAP